MATQPFWRPAPGSVLNIAHRGARSLAPENTLAAAETGHAVGADFWELDVSLTADGQPVVIHDPTLAHTSNAAGVFPHRGPWYVHEFTLAELRRLDFGGWFATADPYGTMAEGRVSRQEAASFANQAIPTLRQALELTARLDWAVNVEIKDLTGKPGHETVVASVIESIEALGLTGRVLVSSQNHDYLRQVKAASPDQATGVLVNRSQADPVGLVRELKAQTYHPKWTATDPGQTAELARACIPTLIYSVNEPKEMLYWIENGAGGLFTDFPQLLSRLKAGRNGRPAEE